MSSLSAQEDYWDSVAERKKFPVPFSIDLFKRYVSNDKAVLDVGCGYGRILNELNKSEFVNLIGIDISQKMIDRGLRQYPYLDLRKTNGGILPFPEDTFHAVILIAVLTCIPESEKQKMMMSETLRVLKVGGILYVHDCMLNSDERNIERYEQYQEQYGEYGVFELPEGVVVRHHTKKHVEEITKIFHKEIFDVSEHTTMNGNRTNGFCYIGRKTDV